MIIGSWIVLGILGFVFVFIAAESYNDNADIFGWIGLTLLIISLVILLFRMFSWIYKLSENRRYTPGSYNCC